MTGEAYSFHSNELPTFFCFLFFFVWHPVISTWVMIYFYECFRPCTHSRQKVMRKKFNISVWAVNWNDLGKSAILLSVALHLCLFFSSRIGFSSRFLFHVYFSSFLALENVKCCSKCSYCNATDHRRRARHYTKTWDAQRLIVDS